MNYLGRFAPTPSGLLHRGSLVAALGSYLDARAHGGRWLLRIEDIDLARCRQTYVDDILFRLEALHLYWDGLSFQSQHFEYYEEILKSLSEHLYYCDCSRAFWQREALQGDLGAIYPRFCRGKNLKAGAIRLALPPQKYTFMDGIFGAQSYDLSALGDPILKRSDGIWQYVLAATADDIAQGITHIVRGADLLPVTALQLHVQALLGAPPPQYTHLPLVLGADGKKLSKSEHAAAYENNSASLKWALQFLGVEALPDCDDIETLLHFAIQEWPQVKIRVSKRFFG